MKSPGSPLDILGKNAKRLRLAKQLTQQTVAEQGGLTYTHYQALEGGRLENPTYLTMEKMAKLFNVEFWKLFHPTEIPEPRTKKLKPKRIRH